MKPKSKKSDQILFWLSILAIVLIGSFLIFVSEVEKSEREIIITTTTTITTTTIETTTTTTSTTITTMKIKTTTSTTTTSTLTTTTIRQKIKTCDDYCINHGYKSGICRTHPLECTIKGVNEVYSPRGNRYCPRGEIEDSCCCVAK